MTSGHLCCQVIAVGVSIRFLTTESGFLTKLLFWLPSRSPWTLQRHKYCVVQLLLHFDLGAFDLRSDNSMEASQAQMSLVYHNTQRAIESVEILVLSCFPPL